MKITGTNGCKGGVMEKSAVILDLLQHWLEVYLPQVKGSAKNTIRSYKDAWRLFMEYMQTVRGILPSEVTFEMLSYGELTGFLEWMEKKRNVKTSTRNNRLAALSGFAEYAEKKDFNAAYDFFRAVGKIPYRKNVDATERAYMSKEEAGILLNLPTMKSPMGYRDHVLLSFMYATGERANEVCVTKVQDIRFLKDGKASIEVHGKGDKTRRIKISEKPACILKNYIRHRGIANQPEAFVFPSQRNQSMSVRCVEDIFAKYITKAKSEYPGLFRADSYPPHSMRHTTAVHMLEAGVPLVVVKQFLGHAHITTTEIYARLSPEVVMERVIQWDKEYWDKYMDEPFGDEDKVTENNEMPAFLK